LKRLIAAIATLVLSCGCAFAWPTLPGLYGGGNAPSPPNTCPQGITYISYDNCDLAQAHGSSGVDANVLTTFNGGTPYLTPPPFNIPKRDYPVGYDTTLTLTPVSSWTPDASLACSKNNTTHQLSCNAATATCGSNCPISGIDFTDWWVLISGTAPDGMYWKLTNNKFKNGATAGANNRQLVTVGSGTRISMDYKYNECDGYSSVVGWGSCLGSVSGGTDSSHLLTWNVQFNDVHDIPSNPFVINGTNADVHIDHNSTPSFDMDQWMASNVSIDSVANTMTVTGPFISTGTNLIHGADGVGSGAQGGCLKYPSVPVNTSSPTSVAGTIGAQISGTPGGLGVYTFTGATGNQTNVILECGRGLHAEINLGGIATNNTQNSMYYRGNLIAFGDDCPANGTANIATLIAPNINAKVNTAFIDYNVLINRVGGNGKGCAAHALSNNGIPAFGSVTIANNYLDVKNTSGFQGNSTTSCFFWPGAMSFVGSQSGTTLTVTSTSNGGPLPTGTQVTQSSTGFGIITGPISVAADGTGTYAMSDSRTQSFSSGGTAYAPNQANAAGTIPYAPFFTGNKNMALSGSAADFVISDAKLTTSAACHT